MATVPESTEILHGGRLVARRLREHGVTHLFTLSGGHLFSIYDGCRAEGIQIIDVRHEQSAAFAAEGWAKVTRTPGVCALTAGPGVTNGMSAIASACQNHSPVLVLGGRAPAFRWGQGSLQEIDHVPFVRPLTKLAATADATAEIPELIDEALRAAVSAPSGPAFVDFPLDQVFSEAPDAPPPAPLASSSSSSSGSESGSGSGSGLGSASGSASALGSDGGPVGGLGLERAIALLADADRPVIMAGTGLYWGHGEDELRAIADELRIPVFLNGLARGCLPADHPCFFSRARSDGLRGADVALVIGVPLDFRLGFGAAFGAETEIVIVDGAEPTREHPRAVAAELYGSVSAILRALRTGAGAGEATVAERQRWTDSLRSVEDTRREAERSELRDGRAPLHPMRIYGELASRLDRDAIVIGDGGDFVSYAGRVVDSYRPGCWLDPGPYGCLGSGPGYALAAKLAHPDRQVVLLLGDGAFGFAGLEFDTLARHGVAVTAVIGNNGIWGLEKHPMEAIYGYSVAAELRPGTRYDEVAKALGCRGELVERPEQLGPALESALAAAEPTVINVLTDPSVAYPRRSNLA